MVSSRIVVFIVAFLCITTGVVGILPYFTSSDGMASVEEKKTEEDKFYTLWFAKQDLISGDPVTRSSLYAKKVSEQEALAYGFSTDVTINFEPAMVANQEILSLSPVSQSLFSKPGDPDYLKLITTPNMVPYSLSLHENNSIGGIIGFDDRVDILALTLVGTNLARSEVEDDFSSLELTTVLSNVRVIKVELPSTNLPEDEVPLDDPVSKVVIELNPEQLSKLLLVQEMSHIKVIKHIAELAPDYQAKMATVFPEQREIRQLRGEETDLDTDMVIESE